MTLLSSFLFKIAKFHAAYLIKNLRLGVQFFFYVMIQFVEDFVSTCVLFWLLFISIMVAIVNVVKGVVAWY